MHQAKVVHILKANYRHDYSAVLSAVDVDDRSVEMNCCGPHFSMPLHPTDDYEYFQYDAYHFDLNYFYGHLNRHFYHCVRSGLVAIHSSVSMSIQY